MATATKTTARKSTAKATAKPDVVEYDFDNWDEEAEEAALAALAGGFDHIVVESDFVGRFSDLRIVKMTLKPRLSLIDGVDMNAAPQDQLKELFKSLGDDAAATMVDEQPITEVVACATRYFELLERVMEREIGELKRAQLGE